jgi:hypothetical protein
MSSEPNQKAVAWPILWINTKHALKPVWAILKFASALGIVAILLLVNKFLISSSAVNNDLILKYLEVLKWPITITVAYLLFKSHIPELLKRLIKISPNGVEFTDTQPVTPTPSTSELSIPGPSTPGSANHVMDITTTEGRADILKNPEIKWELEKIYRIIFGTQIESLLTLSGFPQGLKTDDLNDLYQKHKNLYPNSTYNSTIELLRYLSGMSLIEHEPTTGLITITDIGRLFLQYLQGEGLLSPIVRPN